MNLIVDKQLRDDLAALGVTSLHGFDYTLPTDTIIEPPCSLKWMAINNMFRIGAFSYAVSGYYQAVELGRYVSIGESVQMGRSDHPLHWASLSPMFYQGAVAVLDQPFAPAGDTGPLDFLSGHDYPPLQPIRVGNDVWIGHGAFVMPGVKLGNGCVVAAGAIVTKDVPPYAIVAGVPAVVKRFRFPEALIERFERVQWWNYAFWDLRGARLSDAEMFLDMVERRIADGILPYRPQPVVPQEMLRARAA